MAVALLGKCVAFLGLIVLFYTTCYGFRIRDIIPQTHTTACVAAQGRICPDKKVTTTGETTYASRKWHEGVISEISSRKPPVELDDRTDGVRLRIDRTAEYPKDKGTTRLTQRSFGIENNEVDDDEKEEEALIEVENGDTEEVEENEESVEDSEEDKPDRREENDKEETKVSGIGIDQDENKKEYSTIRRKFARDNDDEKSEQDDDDGNDNIGEKGKQAGEIKIQAKTAKIVNPIKQSKIRINDETQSLQNDDDDDDDHKDGDNENDSSDVKKIAVSKKFEKVRLADKDKARIIKSSPDKFTTEKLKEESAAVVAKATPESTKKTSTSTKVSESLESVKKPIESITTKSIKIIQKPIDSDKKLTKSTENIESVNATSTSKAKVPKITTKIDERSKTYAQKSKTPISPSKIDEQVKQLEGSDVKKVTTKSTSKSTNEVSQAKKQETKTKPKKRIDSPITLSELNDAILHVPSFVPNFTNVEEPECQQHGKIFLRQLRGYRLWALQMLDSSAKIPSSLLRGNVNQLGDYDQCLGVLAHVKVDDNTVKIQGKYCLATVDLYASHPDMKLPVNLMQARAFIRGNMHDPGHFIPKFTTINWALCLPASCSAEDAARTLESVLKVYNGTVGVKFTVNVDPNMCYVKQKSQSYSKETIGVLYFYAMIICLVVVATVRDYFIETEGKGNYSERIIMSFSLRRTIKALLKEAPGTVDITCIHGIRALATIVLYIAHQIITISRIPFSNRVSLTEIANSPVSSALRVSLVYTDAFLVLSGVLTAYNMTKELTKRGEIRWFCRFIARFIRLTPALLAVVFWYAFVMEHVGSGPQWNSVITANAELCKYNAWTNLLYVQNFFPFEEMCATHTHQLALDMQLSFLAPILVFFLQYKPIIGILIMIFLVLLSATLRYIATMNNYLSIVVYHGISLKRLYKTANLTYVLPLHRATPYVAGVGLGVLLHYTGKNVKIHKVFVILGWLIATALGSWSLFSPWRLARRDYVYDSEEATHYAVIGPVLWAVALCWSIFACFTEHGGIVNRFLSHHWLVVFSRISYAVYLTQFAVFFYNVGTTRFSMEFQIRRAIDPLEIAMVIIVSVVLTLFFDLPMQEMKNVIMESTDNVTLEDSVEKKTMIETQDKPTDSAEEANWRKNIIHDDTYFKRHDAKEQQANVQKVNGRRTFVIDDEMYDSKEISSRNQMKIGSRKSSRERDDYIEQNRRGINSKRYGSDDSEEELIEFLRSQQEYENQRNRRSLSRTKDGKRPSSREGENEEEWQRRRDNQDNVRWLRRSEPKGRISAVEADDYHSWEFIGKNDSSIDDQYGLTSRSVKPGLTRSTNARRTFSPENERRSLPNAGTQANIEEQRERELKSRRKQFMEKLIAQQCDLLVDEDNETHVESLKRRSSAEGRIALLRDDLSPEDNMDSWTVSVGPRIMLLGSSQEPSEPEEDGIYMRRREYREQGPPSREQSLSEEDSSPDNSRIRSYNSSSQVTSLEDEDDGNNYNFILTKESKRESFQDLSKLSQEELADSGWNVVKPEDDLLLKPTSGLFKRESIVKSQASEEDPEYLLPERPKLLQQEREHPFKKAWQMQKSKSEEDGSSAYAIKDPKEQQSETKSKVEEPSMKRESKDERSEDLESSVDNEVEATIVLRRKIISDTEDNRSTSKSGTDETDSSVSTVLSRSIREDDHRQASKSETDEDAVTFSWPVEEDKDEIDRTGSQRNKSENDYYDRGQEET